MSVLISESERTMALLNGLLAEYRALISALDAIDSEGRELSWEHDKARVLQEEQRIAILTKAAQAKSETSALVSKKGTPVPCRNYAATTRSRPFCSYCKKPGHIESRCMVTSSAAALASGSWDLYSLAQKRRAIALEVESIIAF